jgi:hypothetical protein
MRDPKLFGKRPDRQTPVALHRTYLLTERHRDPTRSVITSWFAERLRLLASHRNMTSAVFARKRPSTVLQTRSGLGSPASSISQPGINPTIRWRQRSAAAKPSSAEHRKEVNGWCATSAPASRGLALAVPTGASASQADPPDYRLTSRPAALKEWTTAMITAFPAASAQNPPAGLGRAIRNASMLQASRERPAEAPPT